jgi:hypothetical protein
VALALAPVSAARAYATERRSLSFVHTHTGASLSTVYFEDGSYQRSSLERVSHSRPWSDEGSLDQQWPQPQYQNGVMSGVLFVNLSDALCPGNASPATYCANQANSASVYYVWQTGPGSYNQFAALKDSSGTFVQFDAPLNVGFTVPAGAAYGSYAGTSLTLQYDGFGNLWGIPSICTSPTTNLPASCNDRTALNVPQFIIPYDPAASPQQGIVTTSGNVPAT